MFIKTFKGGVHPEEHKYTVDNKIEFLKPPQEIILPLSQHTGRPARSIVKVNDEVKIGSVVAKEDGFISSPVHSPVSGKVRFIKNFINPIYGEGPAIIIENDGKEESIFTRRSEEEIFRLTPAQLVEIIKNSGIVGLGGAAFPTHVKLSIPDGKKIDTLIINGAECEPFLTCDHRLMLEKTAQIVKGIEIITRIVKVKNVFVATEENKLSAYFALEKCLNSIKDKGHKPPYIKLEILKTKYPQGAEKQLIKVLLNREVPPGRLPLDVGCVVQNVGTCLAIHDAVYEGKPLIERCITLTGDCLNKPGNYLVSIGAMAKDVVEQCGGFSKEPAKIIVGGPMMGISQYSLEFPIIKGTTGILFLSKEKMKFSEEKPCIRCARCVDVCPVNLIPADIMRISKYNRWDMLKGMYSSDCLECGACAYICPSHIPLVQYIRLAKRKEMEGVRKDR